MQEIVLDAAGWTTADDFYTAYLAAVGAIEGHGHNLDAVWDSLRGGDLTTIVPPYRVRVLGSANAPDEVRRMLRRFDELAFDARARGVIIDLIWD